MSPEEQKREQRLKLLEDDIGRHLAQSGDELRTAKSWGKPLDLGDGYDETPAELRMGMKILKDAGVVPPEVEAMREIAALQAAYDALPAGTPEAERQAARQRISEKRQALALRLEKLAASGSF